MRTVEPVLHDQAQEAFAAHDALGFVCSTDNHRALAIVFNNLFAAGIYEQALLEARTGTRTNHHRWSLGILMLLLEHADRDRLRAAGALLPPTRPGSRTFAQAANGKREGGEAEASEP